MIGTGGVIMGIEHVHELINNIKNKEIILIEDSSWEEALPISTATQEMIRATEEHRNIKLPLSFQAFLTDFSNGHISIYGVEPMFGVGDVPSLQSLWSGGFDFYAGTSAEDDEVCYIVPQAREIKTKQLVPFTRGNIDQISSDHWVFICDNEYPDNEYPVGYVTQSSGQVVFVLDNFEKWLEVFWEGNKNRTGIKFDLKNRNYRLTDEEIAQLYEDVISILFADYQTRLDLLDAQSKEELLSIYPKIIEANKENLMKYGVYS